MDVRVRLFCVCVVLCVGSGFGMSCSPVQGVLPTVYMNKKLKKLPRSEGLYSHRERERESNRKVRCNNNVLGIFIQEVFGSNLVQDTS
jgi:hypothetical protein